MLAATGLTLADRYAEARPLFCAAEEAFEESGSSRKALKCRYNIVVCDSHLDNKPNMIPLYFDLHRRALKPEYNDLATASHCLLNISREFELIGALTAGLKYVTEAIDLAATNFGTQHYYLCLAHRCHLLCELQRFPEARMDYECSLACAFPEVIASLQVLKPRLEAEFPDLSTITLSSEGKTQHLIPTWRKRSKRTEFSFSPMEDQLIEFLSGGPKQTIDIIEHLYGEKLDHETKLGRFKSLIKALRRKSPYILVNERGNYRLADETQRPRKKKA
jgi:hypothetical protein